MDPPIGNETCGDFQAGAYTDASNGTGGGGANDTWMYEEYEMDCTKIFVLRNGAIMTDKKISAGMALRKSNFLQLWPVWLSSSLSLSSFLSYSIRHECVHLPSFRPSISSAITFFTIIGNACVILAIFCKDGKVTDWKMFFVRK